MLLFAVAHTCYFIQVHRKLGYVVGMLNSKFCGVVLFTGVRTRYGEWPFRTSKAFSTYMKEIPIPNIKPAEKALMSEKLVDEITVAKTATPDADVASLENEVDRMVYALYDLTAEEIAIVEGNV